MTWDRSLRARLRRGGIAAGVVLGIASIIGAIAGWVALMNWIEDTYGAGWSITALGATVVLFAFGVGCIVEED